MEKTLTKALCLLPLPEEELQARPCVLCHKSRCLTFYLFLLQYLFLLLLKPLLDFSALRP